MSAKPAAGPQTVEVLVVAKELPPGTKRRRVQPSHYIELSDELHAYFSAVASRRGVPLGAVIDDVLSKEVAIAQSTN